MSWNISGTYYGPCSCRVGCPCELGEIEADQGWCSGVLVFDIRQGQVEGVNVGGSRAAMAVDWPGGMLGGNGVGRLYFDPSVNQQQRSALEAVLSGKKGGVFEILSSLVTKALPAREAPISIKSGADETLFTVGAYGEGVVKPLKGATGEYTRLLHGAAAFREDIILAKGTGSRWNDPDMKRWESAGAAEQADFDWSA